MIAGLNGFGMEVKSIADGYSDEIRYGEVLGLFIESKEMAAILKVEPVTVRKYADVFEKSGYIIARSDSGRRQYTQKDATLFMQMKELCERSGMTIDAAVNYVVARDMKENGTIAHTEVVSADALPMQYEERYDEMKQLLLAMEEQNRQQAEELTRLHKRMDEQNSNISSMLREVLETRRMVAAAAESRRGWKFWRKKKQTDSPEAGADPESDWKRKINATESLYERPRREGK